MNYIKGNKSLELWFRLEINMNRNRHTSRTFGRYNYGKFWDLLDNKGKRFTKTAY